jgi:hypothetical protein
VLSITYILSAAAKTASVTIATQAGLNRLRKSSIEVEIVFVSQIEIVFVLKGRGFSRAA